MNSPLDRHLQHPRCDLRTNLSVERHLRAAVSVIMESDLTILLKQKGIRIFKLKKSMKRINLEKTIPPTFGFIIHGRRDHWNERATFDLSII
jgi:hypothetical protein